MLKEMRKRQARSRANEGTKAELDSRMLNHRRGELALIGDIRSRAANAPKSATAGSAQAGRVRLGIGDDCALLALRPGEELAVTTDLSIDGRHFRLDWHTPESVGHRVLARGLSDLAAMGARPVAAFLSLGLPHELTQGSGPLWPSVSGRTSRESMAESRRRSSPGSGARLSWIGRFFDGLLGLASVFNVPLAGGDLAESPVAVADIVLAGAVPRGKALLRSGARVGDAVYVTGALGGAAMGLARLAELGQAVKAAGSTRALRITKTAEAQLAPHLFPQPRIAQGLWLTKRGLATAAIDVSDGISTDLAHICEESGVAAEVDKASLPVHSGATLEQALHGGEDYELLFAAPEGARVPRAIAGVAVTRIGRIVRRRSGRSLVTLVSAQGKQALEPRGWEHFS